MRRRGQNVFVLVILGLLSLPVACTPGGDTNDFESEEITSPDEGGAVSMAPIGSGAARDRLSQRNPVDWSDVALESGDASVSCNLDYSEEDAGSPLTALDRETITNALTTCQEDGVMRVGYDGRLASDFAALVERVTHVADELDIGKRVLEIDSRGGRVEDAMEAGDFIAESGWTIWVREGDVCHSSCVFILSAGDNRVIAGRVGIHRIIRMSSTASTRAELREELETVYNRVREYLARNGTADAVADLMMAVPNRSLRMLTPDELKRYGLDGVNPAQDDLDRLHLMRACGEDFVRRRDQFLQAFNVRCKDRNADLDDVNACGLELRSEYGFPDEACPTESPLSEFDAEASANDSLAAPADSP